MNSIPSGVRHSRADHDDHVVLDPGRGQRGPYVGQRVQAARFRIDQRRVVVLPARLVLLRAVVMVHGDHRLAFVAGGGGQVDGGLAAVRADLEHWAFCGVAGGRGEQGQALVGGHEAGGGFGCFAQLRVHL
jgi:hypothetical protein